MTDPAPKPTGALDAQAIAAGALLLVLFDLARLGIRLLDWAGQRIVAPTEFAWSYVLVVIADIGFAAFVCLLLSVAWGLVDKLTSSVHSVIGHGAVGAVLAVPLAAYFSGGPGLAKLMPRFASFALLLLGFAVAIAGALAFSRACCRWLTQSSSRVLVGVARTALIAASVGFLVADRTVLWGLYPPFHLSVAAAGVVAAALGAVGTGKAVRWSRLAAGAAMAFAALFAADLVAPSSFSRSIGSGTGSRHLARVLRTVEGIMPRESPAPVVSSSSGTGIDAQDPAPHVLVISSDGVRADRTSLLSYERDTTPFLARFAADGTVYERAYSPTASTRPTLSQMLTRGLAEPQLNIPAEGADTACTDEHRSESIPAKFQAGGYRTVCDFFHSRSGLACASLGCDLRLDSTTREDAFDSVIEELRFASQPVFAFVHILETHAPYGGFDDAVVEATPGWSEYDRSVRGFDISLEELVRQAEAVTDRPILWAIHSDHAEALGEHGHSTHDSSVYDEQVWVPLVLVGPGVARYREERPVGTAWLLETLLPLAGQPPASATLPLGADDPVGPVFLHNDEWYGVVDGSWKYVEDRSTGERALFDLRADPDEARSLLGIEVERADRLERLLADRFPR